MQLNIVFLGRDDSRLSLSCLKLLLSSDVRPVALCIDYRKPKKVRPAIRRVLRRVYGVLMNTLRRLGLPVKRYRSLTELANANQLEHFSGVQINSDETVERIRKLKPDLIAICGFSRILKTEVINLAAKACINTHPSLLPKFRGANPIRMVLQYGEKVTGVTIHHVTPKIDGGDIIQQCEVPIDSDETVSSLNDKTNPVAGALLVEVIRQIAESNAQRRPQDESEASYYSKGGIRVT